MNITQAREYLKKRNLTEEAIELILRPFHSRAGFQKGELRRSLWAYLVRN